MGITLGPSTIASQFWCELAVHLKREYGEVSTPEKEKGSEIHKDRFLEVLDEVVAEIKTPGDKLHSNIHNIMVGLDLYHKEGLTRELPILARFDSALVMGIIDEVKIVEESDGKEKTMIVEMKTRKSHNPPSSQQLIRDRMQGMIYWYGLDYMINKKTEMGDFWDCFGIDLIENDFNEHILSKEYMDSLQIAESDQKDFGTLLSVGNQINMMLKNAYELPELSKTIEIIYINQKSLNEVHREKFNFDWRFFSRGMNWALEYWNGKRDPSSVGQFNNWKCDFCEFYTVCPTTHKKWSKL